MSEPDTHDAASPDDLDDGDTGDEGGDDERDDLTIVGIGASAGGLTALKTLFADMPAEMGVAFVVVMHLSPEHESHLAEILQPHCPWPVQQVMQTVAIEANRVYVIPPNANLDTIDTHLRLSDLEEARRERAPIDHFFRTLAQVHEGHSVGVILTGTGSDGTLGLRHIKQRGGLTLVQDPQEAEHDGMPRSAIASGVVDRVLKLAQMPEAIIRFDRTRPRLRVRDEGETYPDDEQRVLHGIFGQLRARTGHDFSRYKRSTVMRRIARRMQVCQVETLPVYLETLKNVREEAAALLSDLLINVTEFFRDGEVFDRLATQVIPRLFEGKGKDDKVRVWSVGCSTGEEAYSVAMLLLEEADRREETPQIQVFASDLHDASLITAREGIYPEEIASDVTPERLARFFVAADGRYRVRREVRELVVFTSHNLLSDPPFSHLDLIVCRNVLIYLQRDVQRDVMRVFHYALEQGGLLVLGPSETVEMSQELFQSEEKGSCVYRRRDVRRHGPRLPVFPLVTATTARGGERSKSAQREKPGVSGDKGREGAGEWSGDRDADETFADLRARMVEQFAAPSVLVDRERKLVHASHGAGRFLRVPPGEPTRDVLALVLPPLRDELRAAMHAARQGGQGGQGGERGQGGEGGGVSTGAAVPVRIDGEVRRVSVRVQPATERVTQGYSLITFVLHDQDEEPPAAESQGGEGGEGGERSEGGEREGGADERKRAAASITTQHLEVELALTKGRLQAVIGEFETSQEETQAGNEELQSSNEELQSAMEELETSKEELQSTNEELVTVNQERGHRVEELAQLASDLQNLLAATEIATLFLDRDLRIVRFTPLVGTLFNIRQSDRGRPLSDLTHQLGYPQLQDDARLVLERLVPVAREVSSVAGRWYISRVLPYRTAEERIEGVVVTFIDITQRRQIEEALRTSEESYRTLFNSIDEGFCVVEVRFEDDGRPMDYRLLEGNPAFERLTGLHNWRGRWMREMVPDLEEHWYQTYGRVASTGEPERFESPAQPMGKHFSVYAFRIGEPEERRVATLFGDVTQRKRDEAALRESEARLREVNESLKRLTERLRQLAGELVSAEQRERKRLASLLHDDLQQYLVAAKMQLAVTRKSDLDERAIKAIAATVDMINHAVESSRDLTRQLRPPVLYESGLASALAWLGKQMHERHGMTVELEDLDDADEIDLSDDAKAMLFEATRELLFNVVKHAGVDHATVRLAHPDGRLKIIVEDGGKGFDFDRIEDGGAEGGGQGGEEGATGMGLFSIRERFAAVGGSLTIHTPDGGGTRIELEAGVG